MCQRSAVPTSSSASTRGGFGTHLVLAPSISARRPTRARSSSRKRVQSARSSSVTKSPGRSDSRSGGVSGCSLGPGISPHLSVERWISRNLLNRRRLGAWGHQAATSEATLRGHAWSETPRTGGMPRVIGAKSANLMHGDRSDRRGPLAETSAAALPILPAPREPTTADEKGAGSPEAPPPFGSPLGRLVGREQLKIQSARAVPQRVLAQQVELCSPRSIASRVEARWRPSGFRPGSGRRASQTSLLLSAAPREEGA
jgi:hypothetical protein